MEELELTCNMCGWEGDEEQLETFTDMSDENIGHEISYLKGCPNCKTDAYLMNKENNIPTAEEFMYDNLESIDQRDVEHVMTEFAKIHVEAALKAASEHAEIDMVQFYDCELNKQSVLNAYPLENIK